MTTTNMAEIREASRRLSAAEHPGTIRLFYPFWDAQYRPYLLLALDALPREHFDFKPRPDMLTARQIIVHIAENEWGFVDNIVDGGERKATLHWILDGVQEHEIHHRAQLNTYLQLMGVTPPSV